jgi:hypothetical protein
MKAKTNGQSEDKEALKGVVLTAILQVIAMLIFYIINT